MVRPTDRGPGEAATATLTGAVAAAERLAAGEDPDATSVTAIEPAAARIKGAKAAPAPAELPVTNVAAAEAAYANALPILDRYSARGLIHKNKAARHKSRLGAHIKALKAA